MNLIPAFDWTNVVVQPWTQDFSTTIWVVLMGFLVTTACGWVGNYLILRRMALVGDAISHSVLPGLVVGFLVLWGFQKKEGITTEVLHQWRPLAMYLGAMAAAVVTAVLIEIIHKKSRVKQDAAIGITFCSLFAVGVLLVSLFASRIDLDQDCVLYGEIAYVPLEPRLVLAGLDLGPQPVLQMGVVTLLTVLLILFFYKELLVSSFDPGLAFSIGINATFVHFALMGWLSIVVVTAFEWVGAILVIAMLILPGATASLLTTRFPLILGLSALHGLISAVLGYHLDLWISCTAAAGMVVVGTGLFCLAWIYHMTSTWLRRRLVQPVAEEDPTPAAAK